MGVSVTLGTGSARGMPSGFTPATTILATTDGRDTDTSYR